MTTQHYDLLVIGAGAAGSTASTTAADNGKRVALVERNQIGGTCLNYGCDPTKTLIHIAHLLYQAQHDEKYGLHISEAKADWPAIIQRVQNVINQIRGGTSQEAAKKLSAQDIDVIFGEATFVAPHEITVADKTISADKIIIATGTKDRIPSVEGLKEIGFITNIQAVSLQQLPRRLAIIGGGAIGIEFAQMFARFGVDVTVLEHGPTILDKEDRELAEIICTLLTKEGIRLETDVEFQCVERNDKGKALTIRCGQRGEEQLVVDEILLAVGREPAFDSLHLEKAGVQTTKKGIPVNDTMCTNVPYIWAAGDITGGLQFTHVASQQGKIAAENACGKETRSFASFVIPWVTYTDPALAHVGQTEEQLKKDGVEYQVGRMFFKDVERAITDGNTEGLVKILADKQGKILGGHILAPHAGDLLSPIVLAMQAKLPIDMLANTIQPYPTLVEGVRWTADKL